MRHPRPRRGRTNSYDRMVGLGRARERERERRIGGGERMRRSRRPQVEGEGDASDTLRFFEARKRRRIFLSFSWNFQRSK